MSMGLFDQAAEQLERHTDLNRLEARGTLRLTLRQAGLDTKRLTIQQLHSTFLNLMPHQLKTRGIDSADSTCRMIMAEITRTADLTDTAAAASVDEIFQRIGGGKIGSNEPMRSTKRQLVNRLRRIRNSSPVFTNVGPNT